METPELVDELRAARDALFEALSGVAHESWTTPGLIGEWSARELIAHLGYWAGNATESIHAVESGRGDQPEPDERSVDAVNETVARVARQTDLATVRRREAASFDALVERVRALDPALLTTRLQDGGTLAEAIRADGHGHYREHAEELGRLLGEGARG